MYGNLTDEQVVSLRLVSEDLYKMEDCAEHMVEAVKLAHFGGKCDMELCAMVSEFHSALKHFHQLAKSELTFFIDK